MSHRAKKSFKKTCKNNEESKRIRFIAMFDAITLSIWAVCSLRSNYVVHLACTRCDFMLILLCYESLYTLLLVLLGV